MFELGNRRTRDAKSAVPGDRAFQRQLHCDRRFDLRLLRHRAGLVIDDDKLARREPVDAVGDRGDRERAARRRDHQPALLLAERVDEARATAALLRDEPRRDALEARPPECPSARPRQQFAERSRPISQHLRLGMRRQLAREAAHKLGERLVDRDAEIGAVGIGVELVERAQFEDVRA
jgi:hypothetical protein